MAETFAERAARIIVNLTWPIFDPPSTRIKRIETIIANMSAPEFKRLHDLIVRMRPVVEAVARKSCRVAGAGNCGACIPCQARAVVKELGSTDAVIGRLAEEGEETDA